MNLEKRYLEIHDFLLKHRWLLETEILERFPYFEEPYLSFAKSIEGFEKEDICHLENTLSHSKINNIQYQDFLNQIRELQQLDVLNKKQAELPQELLAKITLKKRHEIQYICEQLKESQNFVDIGSGAGHLSSFLLYKNDRTSTCIDQNLEFQKIGITKLKKKLPEILKRIEFKHATFNQESEIPPNKKVTFIGLHACGNLSVEIAQHLMRNKNATLLSYACCYHKLTPEFMNLSPLAQKKPIYLSNHALTMAAKSYKWQTPAELDKKYQVKKFRYSLHLFLKAHFKSEFMTLGNATKDDYQGDFSYYAKKYSQDLLSEISDKTLNDFYNSDEIKAQVDLMLRLGTIRSHLARLIEIFIIIDRALWLKEKAYQVELLETFDRKMSPRNISLRAWRTNEDLASTP